MLSAPEGSNKIEAQSTEMAAGLNRETDGQMVLSMVGAG